MIRVETTADHAAVRAINKAAFGNPAEAALVDALRLNASPVISLVADHAGLVVGHIMFSPVTQATLAGTPTHIMGLAPMAVLPDYQRQGIGGALVRHGLERCRDIGAQAVVVLGHPAFYPRFGFCPASRFGIRSEYEVDDDVFMALELADGALDAVAGVVKYHKSFQDL